MQPKPGFFFFKKSKQKLAKIVQKSELPWYWHISPLLWQQPPLSFKMVEMLYIHRTIWRTSLQIVTFRWAQSQTSLREEPSSYNSELDMPAKLATLGIRY